jgi:hypothetical protein
MKKIFVAPGPNQIENSENMDGKVAGFWQGLWHGFIVPFTFLLSLFKEDVGVYELHNNGAWYNFGFTLGTIMSFSGGSNMAKKSLNNDSME